LKLLLGKLACAAHESLAADDIEEAAQMCPASRRACALSQFDEPAPSVMPCLRWQARGRPEAGPFSAWLSLRVEAKKRPSFNRELIEA
jgi:hypothetical protein